MDNAAKGALLSGLVFPGLGQIILKHYGRGVILLIVTTLGLVAIMVEAIQLTYTLMEKIALAGGIVEIGDIWEMAVGVSSASAVIKIYILLVLLTGCWIISIIDAYLIGRKIDKAQMSSGELE